MKADDHGGKRAINLARSEPLLDSARANLAFFEGLPVNDRSRVDFSTVRGTQYLEPLFVFSGACAGCGETPYLKLLSQLFGDRLLVANATGFVAASSLRSSSRRVTSGRTRTRPPSRSPSRGSATRVSSGSARKSR